MTVEGPNVRLKSGPLTVIIPRDMSCHIEFIEDDPKVADSVRKTVEAAQQDGAVTSITISPEWKQDSPYVRVHVKASTALSTYWIARLHCGLRTSSSKALFRPSLRRHVEFSPVDERWSF